MATSQIASMLDELMGRNRNVGPKESVREIHWSDSEVCRYYLVQFCPHELFTNTKADLGPCSKLHDEELKAQFLSASPEHYKKAQYVDDFLRFCARMLHELASRIKKAKERLSLTQREQQEQGEPEEELFLGGVLRGNTQEAKERRHQIEVLSSRINGLVEEAEAKGISGEVEEAQGLLKLTDSLRQERDALRHAALPSEPSSLSNSIMLQQKAMEVCDVCGAFLIVGDAQQRIDDHLLGKQHMGYARLRAATDKITEDRRKMREEREKERKKQREEERKKEKSPPRSSRKKRDRRSRSRKRSKSRKRSRSREKQSRSRERRSRSRNSRQRHVRKRNVSRDKRSPSRRKD
eukprot:TRINITY_DN14307_c0_g1_i1.p1 TRINITY_DN14307_c0_g1~~TRINITY_DN14307_c0_g1_i1.p1  ORF type:complete len:350 (-),score=137.04 TRINITY_DN14307_c0_g1_i1:834-1883(-)